MTTPKRISFSIIVAVIVLCTFTVTVFASPQLSDADISFSVKGYYQQYSVRLTWTVDKYIKADGTEVSQSGANYKLSDAFSVTPGGTIFSYRYDTANLYAFRYICFYDAQGNVVPGGYNDNSVNPNFFNVPANASTARITYQSTMSLQNFGYYCRSVSAPYEVNINNYQYLWSELQGISIDQDGYITLPYQTYSYTWFWLDFKFFDSTFQFENVAFTFYSVYTGGYFTGERLLDYSRLSVDSYFTDDNGNTTFDEIGYTSSGDNPYRFVGQIPYNRFSGFRLYVELEGSGQVSTSIKIKISDFELDGEDVSVQIQTQAALAELDQLADHLDLPTPDTSVIYNNVNNVALQLQDQNFSGFDWFGPSGSIVMQMIITTMSIAAISYIIFGKKES